MTLTVVLLILVDYNNYYVTQLIYSRLFPSFCICAKTNIKKMLCGQCLGQCNTLVGAISFFTSLVGQPLHKEEGSVYETCSAAVKGATPIIIIATHNVVLVIQVSTHDVPQCTCTYQNKPYCDRLQMYVIPKVKDTSLETTCTHVSPYKNHQIPVPDMNCIDSCN